MTAQQPLVDLTADPYIPGQTPRPPDCVFAPLKAGLSGDMGAEGLSRSPAFRGGLELLNRAYCWEAHELFEAVWMCLPPASAERHLLAGLIHIANLGLKRRMGRRKAALRIRDRAHAAIAEAFLHRTDPVMTLTRADMSNLIRRVADDINTEK